MASTYITMPKSAKTMPPTISGPANGVRESSGQLIPTVLGAGFVPSLAMMTLTVSGTFILVIEASAPVNSSSQRSEPAGFGPLAALDPDVEPEELWSAGPALVAGVGVGVGVAVWVEGVDVLVGLGVTTCEESLFVAALYVT